MTRTLIKFIICLLASNFTLHTYSQVTIGSAIPPVSGALLDLKEQTDGNSTKGLGLPRVELNSLFIISGNDLKVTIDGTSGTSWDKDEHIGLVVYNIKKPDVCDIAPIYQGIYVWDGDQWQSLGSKTETLAFGVYRFTDSRDGEEYLARNFGNAGDWMLENLRYDPNLHPDASFTNYTHTAATAPLPYTNKNFVYAEGNENPYTPADHPHPTNWDLYNKKNGILYNWAAATNGENKSTIVDEGEDPTGGDPTIQIRGICPAGWHLPSDKEINDLEKDIYENAGKYATYSNADLTNTAVWNPVSGLGSWNPAWSTGNILPGLGSRGSNGVSGHGHAMSSPCPPWSSPFSVQGLSLPATQGGFAALRVGNAHASQTFGYGANNFLWTSSAYLGSNAWMRRFNTPYYQLDRNTSRRTFFNSVRCKKD